MRGSVGRRADRARVQGEIDVDPVLHAQRAAEHAIGRHSELALQDRKAAGHGRAAALDPQRDRHVPAHRRRGHCVVVAKRSAGPVCYEDVVLAMRSIARRWSGAPPREVTP